MTGTRSGIGRRVLAVAGAAAMLSLGGVSPTVLAQDAPAPEPAAEPAPEPAPVPAPAPEPAPEPASAPAPTPPTDVAVGQIGDATVAVAAPPVPPTTTIVAVGEPPVPPTTVRVAVGKPPVPTTVASRPVVAGVAANRPGPAQIVSRQRVGDAAEVIVQGLSRVAELF